MPRSRLQKSRHCAVSMASLLVQANNHGALNLEMVRDEAHLAGLYEIYYNEQSRVISFAATDDHSSPVRVNVYYTTGTSALASRTRTRARRSSFVATSTCRRSQSSSGSRACTRGPATIAASASGVRPAPCVRTWRRQSPSAAATYPSAVAVPTSSSSEAAETP